MDKNVFNEIHPLDFFLLLAAFLYGNLFVINFSTLNWGLLLIALIVLFLEFTNKIFYFCFLFNKQNKNKKLSFSFSFLNLNTNSLLILLNTVKRGFLLGFFIEAFKVGS